MSDTGDNAIVSEWDEVKQDILEFFQSTYQVGEDGMHYDLDGVAVERSHIRKSMYQFYIKSVHGTLGAGNRKRIPECVLAGIRAICPDENGSYMGYKSF